MIARFDGEHAFLSSFAPHPARVSWLHNLEFPTAEHAFQAAKASNWPQVIRVREAGTAAEAKRRGRELALPPWWEDEKRRIMLEVVLAKFASPALRRKLAATSPHVLVEGNGWGDGYWGAVPVPAGSRRPGSGGPLLWKPSADPAAWLAGDNWLGRVLMMAREVLS